jgi:hypothetical protein
MSLVQTGNFTHDMTVRAAEGVRQAAVAGAAGNQATARAADIVHYRACLASAIANKCATDVFVSALRELTGGNS